MRTTILTAILVVTLSLGLTAQTIERSAITSGAGEATSVYGETVQFSIGQAFMTNTLTQNGSNYVTQGFQQPSNYNYVALTTPVYAEASLNKIKAYPNPAVNYTMVSVNLINDDGVKVSIIDTWGQELKAQDYKVTQGKHELNFAFGNVPSGYYTVKVFANKKVYSSKLIVDGKYAEL
ncbi:T9SS type A sorting domain-containing protein [Pedobacter arcticus]|uniref:T9SS type A sorting domain-containing protein n=1 Tax=Pedobacter arcticus TaxID=752140 RepID=UPI0002F07408|nr:T9SS type A sorting domain-containing protein [Pedobacter arcticus]